jgi:hypothetical protein
MSRTAIPFFADDVSALARALKGELAKLDHRPGHVELLNMLARSRGYRNFQHFRAQAEARERLDNPPPAAATPVDFARVERLARCFDTAGRLARWPGKLSHRLLCLWVLWSRIEPKQVYSERGISNLLQAEHLFGDHALLRRDLCDHGLVIRTPDGSEYRRLERQPPAEALALIRYLAMRSGAGREH